MTQKLRNPLENISPTRQKRGFIAGLLLTVLLLVVFSILDAPLTTPSAPYGIVSFELARTVRAANDIISEWTAASGSATFSLLLDFVFIPTYVMTIGLGCTLASRTLTGQRWPLASVSGYLFYGLFLAGSLDIIENISLLVQVFGMHGTPWPQIAFYAAVPKFSLIFIGLVYALYGGSVSLLRLVEKHD